MNSYVKVFAHANAKGMVNDYDLILTINRPADKVKVSDFKPKVLNWFKSSYSRKERKAGVSVHAVEMVDTLGSTDLGYWNWAETGSEIKQTFNY